MLKWKGTAEETMPNDTSAESAGSENLVERLARELGATANAARIYGSPIERDGVTVIPVAKARYGCGGGSGFREGKQGSGGGGGVSVAPLGYIEIVQGRTCFRPIRDSSSLIPLVAVTGLFAALIIRALARLRG
jgi:uncharacterized spore protein YtfJ